MNARNAPIKLLLIDDTGEDRLLYRRLISQGAFQDCEIIESVTGEQGLSRCLEQKPDCVLIDYRLPDLDGLQLLSRLRTHSFAGALIMVTGQGDETVAVQAMKEGAEDYLIKDNLTVESLQATITKALKCHKLQEAKKRAEEKLKEYTAKLKESNESKDSLIRELTKLRNDLEIFAKTDPLTGLFNRREMEEKLRYEKIRFERSRKPFSLILADIDHFKKINDTHGHAAGDRVLQYVADTFRAQSRKQDVVCRWGGEEFIIFLPETHLEGAIVLANKLRSHLASQQIDAQTHPLSITLSFGVSTYNNDRLTVEGLIKEADDCLYQAKRKGRNSLIYVSHVHKLMENCA